MYYILPFSDDNAIPFELHLSEDVDYTSEYVEGQ